MPQQSISALDRRVQSTNNDSVNNTIQSSTEQNILVTDIISEGPIGGLVNGSRSVFLNNDPIDDENDQIYSNSSTKIKLDSNTDVTAQVLTNGEIFKAKVSEGDKYLLIEKISVIKVIISSYRPYMPAISADIISLPAMPENIGIGRVGGGNFDPTFNSTINSAFVTEGKTLAQLRLASGKVLEQGTISGITSGGTTATWQTGSINYNTITAADRDGSTEHELIISRFFKISAIAGNEITLYNAPGLTGEFDFTITKEVGASVNALGDIPASQKYTNSAVQFSTGTLDQEPSSTLEGVGTSSVSLNVSNAGLVKFTGSNYTTITSTGAQAAQIDEVKILMSYPSGCYLQSASSGSKYPAAVAYHIELAVHTGGSLVFNTVLPPSGNQAPLADLNNNGVRDTQCWGVVFKKTAKFSTEFRINLEGLQPFTGFTIRISRITKDDPDDFTIEHRFGGNRTSSSTNRAGGIKSSFESAKGNAARAASGGDPDKHYSGVYPSSVAQAIGLVKEKLSFPYTAYANTSFSSKTFQSQPTRGYECYGLKVQVPANYITREETGDLSAKYTRINETGDVGNMNSPQLWDGSFRPNPVYTDNPAWVFYDICTNNRYGLGDYLLSTDIDKFSLYKVAKYCDELVPDGKGGTEPRFRSNIYLTKATDAYKILKDFATVFRGMLFWSDSQFSAILDEPKEPIYTFSRSNVIDGTFEYQSTGSKTRANQIVVSWNNPEAEYKLEPIIIEDRENQLKTGTVKSEKAVAFGCTSEGQAIRYGRWKLWTAINQTELVSFKTGINAAFLGPGDIINLQDEADFRVPFSGRVNSCNSSSITIDREVSSHLASGYTYTIAVILPKKTVVLNQEVATLANAAGGTTTFNRGDEVVSATIGGATTTILHSTDETTQKNIVSAVDTSNRPVNLQLIEETLVEEQVLNISSISTSEGRDTIGLLSAFSVTPTNGVVWAIKQTSSEGLNTVNSYKEYKILGINESGPTEFDITAVEHYNTKFDLVDRDFTLALPDPLYPKENTTDDVPSPINLRVLRTPSDVTPGEELVVEWDNPAAEGSGGGFGEYEHLGEYEIGHTFGDEAIGLTSGQRVSSEETSHIYTKVREGSHIVTVTTISSKGRRSAPARVNLEIDDIFEQQGPNGRLGGMLKGGSSTVDLAPPVNSGSTKGLVTFAASSYIIAPFGKSQAAKQNTIADADSYSLSCTALANASWPSGANAYLMLDFSKVDLASPNANALRLVVRKTDTTTFGSSIDYWYDAIKYTANAASIWTSAGNVSVTQGSSLIVGSGFLNLKIPDVVTIGTAFAGKIALILSDTKMYLDRPWTTASATGQALKKQELDIDYEDDFLIAPVSYDSTGSGTYKLGGTKGVMTFLDITPDLNNSIRQVAVKSDTTIINYNSSGTQTTSYSNISLDIAGLGYTDAEFNVTGAGFSQTNQTADSSTAYTASTSGALSKVVHNSSAAISYSTTPLVFTIKARERLDPDNTEKQKTTTYTIGKIKEGGPGPQGDQGNPGADGDPGGAGAAGKRSIQGYLYYEKSSSPATAPAAPSSGVHPYTFGTGLVSGTGITDYAGSGSGGLNVWSNIPRPQVVASDNIHYTVRYYGEEATAGASTIADVTFSSVVRFTTFNGVVRFQNGTGTFSDGSTTIDGDHIKTGVLTSNNANISGSAISDSNATGSVFTTAGSYFNLIGGYIATPTFRVSSSDAEFKGKLTITGSGTRPTDTYDLGNSTGANAFLAAVGGDSLSDTVVGAGFISLRTTSADGTGTGGSIKTGTGTPTNTGTGNGGTVTNAIVLQTTGGTNKITIYDSGTPRVVIGKLS